MEHSTVSLRPWQGFTVPKGIVHRTRAPERAVILMIETASIVPTGDWELIETYAISRVQRQLRSMASGEGLRWRMGAMLDGDATAGHSRGTWARLAGGVGLTAALLAWPLVAWRIIELCCLH